MKKLIGLLSLLSVLTVQYGCESYHQKEGMQEEQAREDVNESQDDLSNEPVEAPKPVSAPERGGAAGNR